MRHFFFGGVNGGLSGGLSLCHTLYSSTLKCILVMMDFNNFLYYKMKSELSSLGIEDIGFTKFIDSVIVLKMWK